MSKPASEDPQRAPPHAARAENPYSSPQPTEPETWSRELSRRSLFLALPPVIPLAVHGVVRLFLPRDEVLYHSFFLMGAIVIAWVWSATMLERLPLSLWARFLLNCAAWGAILVVAFFASSFVDWLDRK